MEEHVFATSLDEPDIPLDMVKINEKDKGYGELTVSIPKDYKSIYYKISNRRDNLFGDSPLMVIDDRANGNIYFGDIHAKTRQTDGIKTADEYYYHARYTALLDFAAIADHNSSECSFIEGPFNTALTEDQFKINKQSTEKNNIDGEFATIHCFEQTDLLNQTGHRNVYFRGMAPEIFTGKTLEELYHYVDKHDVMIIPHHHIIWNTKVNLDRKEYARVIEIYSMHCTSEVKGSIFSNGLHDKSKAETGQSAREILNMGYKVGFIAASDNHNGAPGLSAKPSRFVNLTYNGGLAAVWAPKLQREAIYDGMYNRHCYATTGTRIYLNVIADNTPMGGIVKGVSSVNLYIKTAGTAPIAKVELISNKGVSLLYSYKNNAREYTTDYKLDVANDLKWAYVKVTQIDRNMAFASPIFFE
jgi:hypothetical protein